MLSLWRLRVLLLLLLLVISYSIVSLLQYKGWCTSRQGTTCAPPVRELLIARKRVVGCWLLVGWLNVCVLEITKIKYKLLHEQQALFANPIISFSLSMGMSRLTRDGTAEPVSRDQILRHARGQGNIIFPVQLTTSRIGNLTRLIHTLLYVMTICTLLHTSAYNVLWYIVVLFDDTYYHMGLLLQ